MSETVWYKDPKVLLSESDFFPWNYNNQTETQRINAIARSAIVFIVFILLFHRAPIKGIIIVLFVTLLLTIIIQSNMNSEGFTPGDSAPLPLEPFEKQVAWPSNYEEAGIQSTPNNIMPRTKHGVKSRPINGPNVFAQMVDLNKQWNNDLFGVINREEMYGRDHYSRNQLRAVIGESNRVAGMTYAAPRYTYHPSSYFDQLGLYQLSH